MSGTTELKVRSLEPNRHIEDSKPKWSIMGFKDGKCIIDIVLYNERHLPDAISMVKEEFLHQVTQ